MKRFIAYVLLTILAIHVVLFTTQYLSADEELKGLLSQAFCILGAHFFDVYINMQGASPYASKLAVKLEQ